VHPDAVWIMRVLHTSQDLLLALGRRTREEAEREIAPDPRSGALSAARSHDRRLLGRPRPLGGEVLAAAFGDGHRILVADAQLALGITCERQRTEHPHVDRVPEKSV
jgi:hypothetical protein